MQIHVPTGTAEPLQEVLVSEVKGSEVLVIDPLGRVYHRLQASPETRFLVGGACGVHEVRALGSKGETVDSARFRVRAETRIQDQSGEFADLLFLCRRTIADAYTTIAWQHRLFKLFIYWLRDHTHVLKAARYFEPHVRDGTDLFRLSQRSDGMIWDWIHQGGDNEHFWESMYTSLGCFRRDEDGVTYFVRMPVENDVEYLFVESLYHAWQASADDVWMAANLHAAVRALEYSVKNPLRFSSKFGLLKRAYTIDTWDFVSTFDQLSNDHVGLLISPDTRFGIMFGDNTGYARACEMLAEMLERAGKSVQAHAYRARAQQIRERVIQVAWQGTHFRHHVPEDPADTRDFGVDEASQVSLSNAYSLNRNIPHEIAVAIIRTYQHLRDALPEGSPGEWYTIYPPFQRGWERHCPLWEYMNGGVTPIVAGELAHGAFEHGFEEYGTDILRRVRHLAHRSGNRIRFCYRGGGFKPPQRNFTSLRLTDWMNTALTVPASSGKLPWLNSNQEGDDLHQIPLGEQVFQGVPFTVEPGSVAMNSDWGHQRMEIPVDQKAHSLYLLHTVNNAPHHNTCGSVTLVYADETESTEYVDTSSNVSHWVFPVHPKHKARVAWTGSNRRWTRIGVTATGIDNPHPDKPIRAIRLETVGNGATWAVLSITLSDAPVYFSPELVSFGGPDEWSAGAVAYALIEGLAGVKDRECGFRTVQVSPRWIAANEGSVKVCVHYPASDGYVAYEYRHLPEENAVLLVLTGSGERAHLRIPIPHGCSAHRASVDGKSVPFAIYRVEDTVYVDVEVSLPTPTTVRVEYSG